MRALEADMGRRAVENPVAEIECAMISDAVDQYRKFVDAGLVEGWEVRLDHWPKTMEAPMGQRGRDVEKVEVLSSIIVDGVRWGPAEVKNTVIEFLKPGGGMDRLIESCGLRLDGDAIRGALGRRFAPLNNRAYTGVARTRARSAVGVLGHADAQVAMGRMVSA